MTAGSSALLAHSRSAPRLAMHGTRAHLGSARRSRVTVRGAPRMATVESRSSRDEPRGRELESDLRRVGALEIDEDVRLTRWTWRAQRAAWVLLAVALVAAL